MNYTMEQYRASAEAIQAKLGGFVPKVAMVLGSGATRMTARELLRELRQMRQAGFNEHASPRTMNRSSLASRLPKDVQEALERLRRGQ